VLKPTSRVLAIAAFACALQGLASVALAQRLATLKPLAGERLEVVENWVARLRLADQSLQAGEWKQAKKTADFLLEEMRTQIAGGEEAGRLLGFACLYRGIAQSGLENHREAAWDYRVAQALYPQFSKADFKPYGPAGAALEAERKTTITPMPRRLPADTTAPSKLRGEQPWFPKAKYNACDAQPVMIMTSLGTDGMLVRPEIFGLADPVLAFAAMDALRTWKFKPATREGKSIEVPHMVKVNYQLLYCKNAAAVAAGAKP
jgi:hypothetical protein